jgi:hypothetical protein
MPPAVVRGDPGDAKDSGTQRGACCRRVRLRETDPSPQKIIADGTDWRFLDELERELKA